MNFIEATPRVDIKSENHFAATEIVEEYMSEVRRIASNWVGSDCSRVMIHVLESQLAQMVQLKGSKYIHQYWTGKFGLKFDFFVRNSLDDPNRIIIAERTGYLQKMLYGHPDVMIYRYAKIA